MNPEELLPKEIPRDKLDEWCLENFRKLTFRQRESCFQVLKVNTPGDMLAKWRDQYSRGMRIGSHDLGFHFGVGMQVRNKLRAVVRDEDLPPIQYPDGQLYRNWDDFYMGALQDFAVWVANQGG